MNIQPSITVGPGTGPQGISFPTQSGGSTPGALEGIRADWNVRMNVFHRSGFVGGVGRMLIHNQTADERTQLVFYLPAARNNKNYTGRLEMMSAVICSAKPGMPAAPGQPLVYRAEGARVIVTVPVLRLNDWIYVDVTWQGAFPQGGVAFPGGQVPLGEFHPQVAIDVPREDGQVALAPVPARYHVELGADLGTTVRLEADPAAKIVGRPSEDGNVVHEFTSFGKAHIQALLAPPNSVLGDDRTPVEPPQPAGPTPSLDPGAPRFTP